MVFNDKTVIGNEIDKITNFLEFAGSLENYEAAKGFYQVLKMKW